jgi:alpha-ribazole phosphatase
MVLAHVLSMAPSKAMAGVQVPYACRSKIRLDQTEFGTLSCLVSHG